jgi:hypothetical protein
VAGAMGDDPAVEIGDGEGVGDGVLLWERSVGWGCQWSGWWGEFEKWG